MKWKLSNDNFLLYMATIPDYGAEEDPGKDDAAKAKAPEPEKQMSLFDFINSGKQW